MADATADSMGMLYAIQHRHARNLWLGRRGEVRHFPMFFANPADAWQMRIDSAQLTADWRVVAVACEITAEIEKVPATTTPEGSPR